MTKVTEGIAFARVTSKAPRRRSYSYTLSNGSTIYSKTDCLQLGQWYFFHLRMNIHKQLVHVSNNPVTKQEGEEFALKLKNLQQYADKAVVLWGKASQAEKAVIAKSVGCALTGFGAASFACDAIGSLIFEGLGGVLSGGTSLVISGALATISAIQYEEAKTAVKVHTAAIQEYHKAKNTYAAWLCRLCPIEYLEMDVLDPEIQSLVLRLKKMVTDFEWPSIWNGSDEINFNFATA